MKPPESDLRRLLADGPPVLWYDASLDIVRAYGDDTALATELERLEQTVFTPLLEALRSGRLARVGIVTFTDAAGVAFAATRASLRRFWRGTRALSHYAPA